MGGGSTVTGLEGEQDEPGLPRKKNSASAQRLGSGSQLSRCEGHCRVQGLDRRHPEGQVLSDWLPQDASQASGVPACF